MKNTIIVLFNDKRSGEQYDLEVPVDITANELIYGLNMGLHLGINLDNVSECYLCTREPIALLRGNTAFEEFGMRDGTIIDFER